LLAGVKKWTQEAVLVEEAAIFMLSPVTVGGDGAAHLPYNSVRIEMTAGEKAELPEVLRLAWLPAQLKLDLPPSCEGVPVARLDLTAGLAMVPVALSTGESFKLTSCTPDAIARAVRTWVAAGERTEALAATVALWWDVSSKSSCWTNSLWRTTRSPSCMPGRQRRRSWSSSNCTAMPRYGCLAPCVSWSPR